MEQANGNNYQDGGVTLEMSSSEPDISVSAIVEEAPTTLTVAAIVGVTLVVLVAIVIVFVLGVLIDCRQQKMLQKKMGEVKRAKSQRRASAHPDGDAAIIVDNMEEAELSAPPGDALRTIP